MNVNFVCASTCNEGTRGWVWEVGVEVSGDLVKVEGQIMANQVVKVKRETIAACMTCPLCNNLFRDATTISECLHTCESLVCLSLCWVSNPSLFLSFSFFHLLILGIWNVLWCFFCVLYVFHVVGFCYYAFSFLNFACLTILFM